MSGPAEQKIEVVRRAVEAFRTRDVDALKAMVAPEFEFRSALAGGIEGAVYQGRDSIERYLADLAEVFEDWHTEDERYLDAGGDRLLLLYRIVGRGKESGVPIDQPIAILWTLRDNRLLIGDVHLDQKRALAAAGLEQESRMDAGQQ